MIGYHEHVSTSLSYLPKCIVRAVCVHYSKFESVSVSEIH